MIRVAERSETQLGAHLERHRLSARSLRIRRGSGSAAQRHDRQVLRSGVKIDLQIEFQARLAFDERPAECHDILEFRARVLAKSAPRLRQGGMKSTSRRRPRRTLSRHHGKSRACRPRSVPSRAILPSIN